MAQWLTEPFQRPPTRKILPGNMVNKSLIARLPAPSESIKNLK